MSGDIKNWKNRLVPINADDWSKYIESVCNGSYNGQDTTVKLLRPVVYYYYIITNCTPINQVDVSFDIDHIIPQEIFKDNLMVNQSYKDSLVNLALLPTKENISKKSKRLNKIADSWLKMQITVYTGIPESDFDLFSDLSNFDKLKEQRSELFSIAFSTNRTAMLSN